MKTESRHFAEQLLHIKLAVKRDKMRQRSGFSEDLQTVNTLLNNPKVKKTTKIAAYRNWLLEGQPCIFGRSAARGRGVFVCLLEEKHILIMRNGDEGLRETIQDHQKVWKRYALHGQSSSFVIVVISEATALASPGPELKDLCRRLMELYLDCSVDDNEILPQREYVYLAETTPTAGRPSFLRFTTLPNIFCAQGDKRWWHDHRTPGAVMVTSNALGHFMYCHSRGKSPDSNTALKQAMQTILNAHTVPGGKKKRLPATELISRKDVESSPVETNSTYGGYSPRAYRGRFHTDHLIPSEFFVESAPSKIYDDLDLSYIWDTANPEHRELTQGEKTDFYTVGKEVWVPEGKNLLRDFTFERAERVAAYKWLESRLWERCK